MSDDDQNDDFVDEISESSKELPKSSNEITMKKSAYHGLVITAIVGIAIGTFFAGYFVAYSANSPDYVTQSQLENLLSKMQPTGTATAPQKLIVSLDDDPMIGNPNAPVTVVEFSDFQCPFCSRFHQQTLPLIIENYVETGAVNVVYRDFPIDSIHPNARITHIASECADEQGKFWPYHDILFERQSEWNKLDSESIVNKVVEYAEMLSLDTSAFSACLSNPAINAEINADKTDGSQYGVSGTPAFFIGNVQTGYTHVNGAKPFEAFVQVINDKLR